MLVIFSLITLLEKWYERRERDRGKGEKEEGGREGKEGEIRRRGRVTGGEGAR